MAHNIPNLLTKSNSINKNVLSDQFGRSFFIFSNICQYEVRLFDNVDVPQPIDRNGLLCNNVFEFAPNVFAIYTTRDLSVDYGFNLDANLPWYIPVWRAILKGLAAISKWWQEDVPNWVKVTVGIILLIASIVIAYFTCGASTALTSSAEILASLISQALTQLLIGIGIAVASWLITALITGDSNLQVLENAVADAFFFAGLFAFVSASFNSIKFAFRVHQLTDEEILLKLKNEALKYIDELHAAGEKPRFVSVAYNKRTGKMYTGYNSEPIDTPMFSRLLRMGARDSCAETHAISKALSSGAKFDQIYLYTHNVKKNIAAYLCDDCTKTFYQIVAKCFSAPYIPKK